ncbi:unnamed protein product [Schistocephalus solidus]|uniref:DUF4201 domain-containing protein n=1 Tax=Schistocephalus solidus TaxID=70667 RepID=A0A183SRA0_SCHSO|nr:unnamed protein product [Schistocephalus solidus]
MQSHSDCISMIDNASSIHGGCDDLDRSEGKTQLAELHNLLIKESARTSSLLAEVSAVRKRLEPDDLRRKIQQLHDETALRCCGHVDSSRQSQEEQVAILSVFTDAVAGDISVKPPPTSLQALLDAKEKLRALYARQIEVDTESLREKQRGLNYQVPFLPDTCHLTTYQPPNHSTRLKVLKFGLEERLRHLADAQSRSKNLEDQLETVRSQQHISKIETIQRLFAVYKTRREHIVETKTCPSYSVQLQTMQTITPAIWQNSEQQILQMAQTMARLNTQIQEANIEVAQLKQNPVLRLQQLQTSIFAMKTAITNSEARRNATKVDIRSGVKQFKKLSCENEKLKKHAAEEKGQLDLVLQIEHEKEEYERRLMETKLTLGRLHRQVFFATTGTKPRVHFEFQDAISHNDAASLDDIESEVNAEVTFGKRCAFYCHEITRLRQRTTWLEESLREVITQKTTPARRNEIRAMLPATQQPNPNVTRRPKRSSTPARPLSMTAIDLPMRKLQLGKVTDTRQRSQCNLNRSHSDVAAGKYQSLVRKPTVPPAAATVSGAPNRVARSKSFQETRRITAVTESNKARYETVAVPHRLIFRPTATNRNTFSAFRSTKVRPRSNYDL